MSTYEHDLTARFAALAPRPLPGDWDDVLDRAGAVRPRRRRLEGRRRKLVVALAVAVLVPAVAAAAYGTVRIVFLDRGFIGLPPVGATPSAPESGELVLSWQGRSETHRIGPDWKGRFLASYVGAWVYADGRMIWWRDRQVPEGANELTSGYLEQRLTPEGVELLRSEVVGLLDRSRALLETVPPDDDPRPGPFRGLFLFVPRDHGSGGGSTWGSVEVRDGDRFVRLRWSGVSNSPDVEGTIARPEQLSALRRIDALLTDPTSALPSSAWAVSEVRAYVASHYAVCMHTVPPKDASHLLALLPAQAADVLRDNSLTPLPRLAGSATYCSKLTTEEAREVANAVSGLERPSWAKPLSLVYRVAEGAHDWEATMISFDPYLPHGQFVLMGGGR